MAGHEKGRPAAPFVVWGREMAAAQPPGLLSTLHTIKDKVRRVKVIACLLLKD